MTTTKKKTTVIIATPLQISEDILDEIKGAITEGVFISRWTLIEAYHKVGELIVTHEKEMPKNYVSLLVPELKMKERTIYQAIQFYRDYPDISKLPMGKNISWHKIANKLLPEPRVKGAGKSEAKLAGQIEQFLDVCDIQPRERPAAKTVISKWERFKKNKGSLNPKS